MTRERRVALRTSAVSLKFSKKSIKIEFFWWEYFNVLVVSCFEVLLAISTHVLRLLLSFLCYTRAWLNVLLLLCTTSPQTMGVVSGVQATDGLGLTDTRWTLFDDARNDQPTYEAFTGILFPRSRQESFWRDPPAAASRCVRWRSRKRGFLGARRITGILNDNDNVFQLSAE